jgi:hypothetical protein
MRNHINWFLVLDSSENRGRLDAYRTSENRLEYVFRVLVGNALLEVEASQTFALPFVSAQDDARDTRMIRRAIKRNGFVVWSQGRTFEE